MRTHILAIDDEPDFESLIRLHFRRKIQCGNYSFHFIRNGLEALSLIQSGETFDVVLLDISLPDIDGVTLLQRISELMPMSRTIMVTAYGEMSKIRTAMNHGAFDFIGKPFDLKDLELTIEKTAEHVRLLRESKQLKTLDEMKSHFFDNITHEFRTPLTLILAPVEKLLRNPDYSGDLRRHLHLIQRNGRQLLRTINQLLELTRLEAGHLAVVPQAGYPGAFIDQLVQAFIPLAEEHNLKLAFHNDVSEGYYFDAEKLEHIVNNLIANALKFTSSAAVAGDEPPKIGRVTVSLTRAAFPEASVPLTQRADEWVDFYPCANQPGAGTSPDERMHWIQLMVQDTGIGIQPQKLPYIFDRFYELSPALLRPGVALVPPSTGIGLSLVKELVELMRGTISVSSAVGQGTRFTVELPLLPIGSDEPPVTYIPAPSLSVPVWTDPPAKTRRIPIQQVSSLSPTPANEADQLPLVLVLEDNAELCQFLAEELAEQYRVLTAADGREGWAITERELPDVVISDVMMPNMNGYQFTHQLKTTPATDHIAVILLTARATQPGLIEGLQQGADEYIAKPFHLDELHLRLRNLLTRRQKLRECYQQQLARPGSPLASETLQDRWLKLLYDVMEQHLDDSTFGVEQLADHLAVSRRTLHRKVQSLTHLSPNELIRQYRLRRAAELLRTGLSVSDTAYQVGFEAPSYFSQCFKEVFQVTPSEYPGIAFRES
ncbi:hypothetical protein GCM10023187_47000 [Nibrella viscosa]|uniref:histidine kinase n=1 Tax=Nibrella viscosa TaxID=1084524 RepID=A0ABP8KUD4_9BACT